MSFRLSLLLVALVALSGCSIFASKGDYRAYRQLQMADNDQDLARAQSAYMDTNPNGAWSSEVGGARTESESQRYQENNSSSDGLRFYLEVYPEGTFSEQARLRLGALEQVEGRREVERENQAEVRREQRRDAAEERRTWAARAVGFWTGLLGGLEQWDTPISNVAQNNPEFSRAFGGEPRPRCSRTDCIKYYRLEFGIPVPGRTLINGLMEIYLRLRMRDGNLYRVEMLMPNRGFSRWFELENRRPVADMDPDSRNEALTFALERVLPFIESATTGAERIDMIPDPIEALQTQASEAAEAGPEENADGAEEPEFIIPIALEARRAGDLLFVIFSASPDDEGDAYDGLYIEYAPADAEGAVSESTP